MGRQTPVAKPLLIWLLGRLDQEQLERDLPKDTSPCICKWPLKSPDIMPSSDSFNPEENCVTGKFPGINRRVWYYAAAMKICPLLLLLFSLASFAQTRPTAGDETQQLLQALADAPGPSGFEEPVRKIMVERMKPLSEKLSYDGLGSVIAVQGTSGPRIMVDSHMDELGGMVRRVSNDGYLTMQMLGGWLDQALVDQRWTILGSKGPVRAITGIRDIHIAPQ